MGLRAAPWLRRQRTRRRAEVRRTMDMIGRTVDMRAWELTEAQYVRFLDLLRGANAESLDAVDQDEIDQVWAWYLAGFDKRMVEAWESVPGYVSNRPRPAG
jgi:hypothetical protein